MKLSFILIAITLMFSNCNKDNVVQPGDTESSFTITGQLSNWVYGDSIEINLNRAIFFLPSGKDTTIIYGSSKIDNNGYFKMHLDKPPIAYLSNRVPPRSIMSDTSARIARFSEPELYSKNQMIGYTYISEKPRTDSTFPGSYYGYYMYCTKDVTITGVDSTYDGYNTEIYINNIVLLKGWNIVLQQEEKLSSTKSKFTTIQNNSLKPNWFYTIVWLPNQSFKLTCEPPTRLKLE